MCLAACVTITPLLTVAKVRAAKLRMIYGVWMFAIGALGLAITILLDWKHPAADMAGNSVEWTGTGMILLLLPMTLTSNAVAQKLLGPEWKRWQRWLLWIVYALVLLHLLVLQSWSPLIGFCAATFPMIILRAKRIRQSVKTWRASGYSTGGWWIGLAVLGSTWLAGVLVLVTLLGVACFHALSS